MASLKEDIKQARTARLNWFIVVLTLVVVTVLSLPTTEYFDLSRLKVGERSPVTYRADQQYRVEDLQRRRQKLENKLQEIHPVFVEDQRRHESILGGVRRDIEALQEGELTFDEQVDMPGTPEGWQELREITMRVIEFLLERGVVPDRNIFDQFSEQNRAHLRVYQPGSSDPERREVELSELNNRVISREHVVDHARNSLDSFYQDFPHRELVLRLVRRNVKPTIAFRKDEFQQEVQRAREQIEPYTLSYRPGEVIVERGEIVNKRVIETLRQINRQKVRFKLSSGLASLGVTLLGMVFLFLYLREFDPGILKSSNKLGLLAVLVVLLTLVAKAVSFLQPALPTGIEYIVPFAGPIILVALMLNSGLALLLSLFLALLTVTFFDFTFELFVLFLLGGLAGIFSVREVERRALLVRSGFVVAGVQVLGVALFFALRTGELLTPELGMKLLWSGVNGVAIVPIFVVGLLPFLENGFDITTNFRLLELADLNHPLLREMFERAPGTYQHSIMLSNLCERAAQAIGANALLVRVGSYYHDLGKVEIAEYFIENQGDRENPHDDLKPTLSASILKSHVKKGSARAREAGLPEEIVDLIEQHHGTSLIQFFYHRALEQEEDEVSKEEFTYPGPRPQTREAGICMLGDAVEAASRTLEDPSPKKIRERVTDIVYEKFEEGQLNECDLTLKDLDTIVETFTRVLGSVYHHRIEYPDEGEVERLEEAREAQGEEVVTGAIESTGEQESSDVSSGS